MRPVIILNRGSRSGANDVAELRAALARHKINADVRAVDGGAAEKAARRAVGEGAELVIAAGGDGTISAVAEALADTGVSLGILPRGTLNHFARDLGIPLDLDEALAVLQAGRRQKVDLAQMNGSIFINNSAIGLYPMMVLDRDAQQKRLGRSKRLAMLIASARMLARFDSHRLTLKANDETADVTTPLLFVGNNDYRLEIGGAGRRESLSDGRLCVYVMRKNSRLGMVSAALRALVNRTRPDDMLKLDDVQRLQVRSGRARLHVAMDGEVRDIAPPLDYRIRPGALSVVTP